MVCPISQRVSGYVVAACSRQVELWTVLCVQTKEELLNRLMMHAGLMLCAPSGSQR